MNKIYEYERMKKIIGEDKYNQIEEYLEIVCPKERVKMYFDELDKMWDFPMNLWEEINNNLVKKYGIILFKDVLYNQVEWLKFEKWYYEKKLENEKIKRR